jgi:ketosteroid isomerase-like protein
MDVAGPDHAETVKRSYEALNGGDIAGALAALDENAEWHEISTLPDAGVYRGRETIRRFLAGFMESWDELAQEIEDVVEAGDRVGLFIHLEARGRESGIAVDRRYAHVWTMRGGRGVRVDAYDDPAVAREALGRVAETPQTPAATTVTKKTR